VSSIKLSVVIVNYNTREDLRACLESLRSCRPMPEVIVVDNDSRDGSADMVRDAFPEVVLLAPGRNTWFCGGNNLGLAAAHGEYALLLNPDTIVPTGVLARMVAFMDTNSDYAGITVQLRYPDGSIQRTCSRVPTYAYLMLNHTLLGWLLRRWRARENARHWYADWGRDERRDVEVLPGSCLMMRRETLWLDDTLLLYFPEDDLARRYAGAKFCYLADAHIIHREKAATRTWTATRVYFRDLMLYTRKHHGTAQAALLWLGSRPLVWGMLGMAWWRSR
jgi:GT2 family glycosyltransferase